MSFFLYAIARGPDVHAQVSKAGIKSTMGVSTAAGQQRPQHQRTFAERAGSMLGGVLGAVGAGGGSSLASTLLPQATEMAMAHLGYLCEVSPCFSYGGATELHGVVQVCNIRPARTGGVKIPGIICQPFGLCDFCAMPYQALCHGPGSMCGINMPLNVKVVSNEVTKELHEGKVGGGHTFTADIRAFKDVNELAMELKKNGLNPSDAQIVPPQEIEEVVPLIGSS